MKRTVRLYNILLPIWLLWIFPQVWLIVLPGNLAIDCAVLLLALLALGCTAKQAVLRRVWWRVWLNGFLADAARSGMDAVGAAPDPMGVVGRIDFRHHGAGPSALPCPFPGRWPGWRWPVCASISWTGGPCAAVPSWSRASSTLPPWPWP